MKTTTFKFNEYTASVVDINQCPSIEFCNAVYAPKAQEFFETVEKDKLAHSDTSWMDNI